MKNRAPRPVRKTSSPLSALIFSLLILSLFSGCREGGIPLTKNLPPETGQPDDPGLPVEEDTEPEQEEDPPAGTAPESDTTLRFTLPDSLSSNRSRGAFEEVQLFHGSYRPRFYPQLELLPVYSGSNELVIRKDEISFLGLIETPAVEESAQEKDITSAISLIGSFSILAAGLDTLPLGSEAQDSIDLGVMTVNSEEKSITSELSTSDAAVDLGQEEEAIAQFGKYDQLISKFSNQDIDRSGTPDLEDGLIWDLILETAFEMEGNIYDVTTGTFLKNPTDFAPQSLEYRFVLINFKEYNRNPETLLPGNSRLYLPENPAGDTFLYSYGTYTSGWLAGESPSGTAGQSKYYRYKVEDPNLLTHSPLSGDFSVEFFTTEGTNPVTFIELWKFYLDGVKFISPESEYEGFVFPVLEYKTSPAVILQEVSWRWIKISEGQFLPASPEEVKLQIASLVIAFDKYEEEYKTLTFIQQKWSPDSFWAVMQGTDPWYSFKILVNLFGDLTVSENGRAMDYNYYESGTIDTTPYDFPYDHDTDSFIALIEDFAGNFYGFLFSQNSLVQ